MLSTLMFLGVTAGLTFLPEYREPKKEKLRNDFYTNNMHRMFSAPENN